jgi:sulfatase maturation enzyme AslB (radical SAM superfamily)
MGMFLTKRMRIYPLSADKHVICNALTGEISVIRRSVYEQIEAIKAGRAAECDPEVLRALENSKLAFRSRFDEDSEFCSIVERAFSRYLEIARTEYCFAINTLCNFNCVYCYESEAARSHASTLSEEQLDAAFHVLDRALSAEPKPPAPEFTLYGGEPLLAPSKPTVVSLIERVASRGYKVNILTNGYTLNRFFDVFDAHHKSQRNRVHSGYN